MTEQNFSLKCVLCDYMEKFNPSYSLTEFKNSDFEITRVAERTAADLGFNKKGIKEVISTMELKHFYK